MEAGGRSRLRRTGIIPGVMIQQFDRERERRKEKGRRAEREEGREDGGAALKPLTEKKENRLNAKIIKEVFGIHGSGWRISGEKSGRDC